MSIVNYYDGFGITGTTLTDKVSANNGTIAASPAVSNGNIVFTGTGQNVDLTNPQRVDIATATPFQETVAGTFSILCRFKTSATSGIHVIWSGLFGVSSSGGVYIYNNAGTLYVLVVNTTGTQKNYISGANVYNNGEGHSVIISYTNDTMRVFIDGGELALTNNNSQTGNLYPTGSPKVVIGAAWRLASSKYRFDYGGSWNTLINFDHNLNAAEAGNYQCYDEGCL